MPEPVLVSLNHRLRNIAAQEGVPPQRVRNRFVFQRVLARLARDPRWVLKGGFRAEDEVPATWRVVVDALVARAPFATATIDVVTQAREPTQGLDEITIRPVLGGQPFSVRSVDVARHAAEKTHAYARIYAHERPSSRVKDLVDLALLVEHGMIEKTTYASALRTVFAERDGAPPPLDLPEPPGDWRSPFASMAAEVGLNEHTNVGAAGLVRTVYLSALDDKERR